MNRWPRGLTGGQAGGGTGGWTDGQGIDERADGQTSRWLDGHMDRWVYGRADGWEQISG
jgi:hypothetical protein